MLSGEPNDGRHVESTAEVSFNSRRLPWPRQLESNPNGSCDMALALQMLAGCLHSFSEIFMSSFNLRTT